MILLQFRLWVDFDTRLDFINVYFIFKPRDILFHKVQLLRHSIHVHV